MFFPEVVPSRDKCFADLATALLNQQGRIYLDASLLIHCYEMSPAARDELLSTLESWGERVCVPTWAAKETWEYINKRISRRPLQSPADRTKKELQRFRKEALRYVDDDTLPDLEKAEYQAQLEQAVDAVTQLMDKVSKHEPRSDATTAILMPFIESRRLKSDLETILEKVVRIGPMRHAHDIPPGFADAAPANSDDQSNDSPTKTKGKQKNPHGDLIIWLEILADCKSSGAQQLVVITRDTTKGDWAYAPDKIRDDRGRPQKNAGMITLPLPLLTHEAVQTCPSLQDVQIVSVEMLAQVLNKNMRVPVPNLAAALQAGEDDESEPVAAASESMPPGQAALTPPSFSSADMAYDYSQANDVDNLIQALHEEGWRAQNAAARHLEPVLPRATRDQRVQIGRGLVVAANDNAMLSVEVLRRLLSNDSIPAGLRADVLIGTLAEIYIAETGEPKRPEASMPLTELVFEFEDSAALEAAYTAVLGRLTGQRRKYLGLPRDHSPLMALEMVLEGAQLRGASVSGHQLLEEDAPPARAMHRTGRDLQMSVEELTAKIATQFAVPAKYLGSERAASSQIVVPEHLGFIPWGPNTGTILR